MALENGTPLKRSYLAHFIDDGFGTLIRYIRLGEDLESYEINTGINTESKTNILDEVSVRISEYAPTAEHGSYICKKGDPLFEKLYDNFQKRATADAYETSVVDAILDNDGTITRADKTAVRVMPSKFGGPGGSELECAFTINYTGTPEALTPSKLSIANGILTIAN